MKTLISVFIGAAIGQGLLVVLLDVAQATALNSLFWTMMGAVTVVLGDALYGD